MTIALTVLVVVLGYEVIALYVNRRAERRYMAQLQQEMVEQLVEIERLKLVEQMLRMRLLREDVREKQQNTNPFPLR